jgi:hypothetical protein
MIIGVITVYKCDGVGCDAHKSVSDEHEGLFARDWFAGLDKHFCTSCRYAVANASAIADQERRLAELRSQIEKGRAAHVH